MATKAVHLELVSDLTTQTFLAAFKCPKTCFQANVTNFVDAPKQLQQDSERNKTLSNLRRIQLQFNALLWPTACAL